LLHVQKGGLCYEKKIAIANAKAKAKAKAKAWLQANQPAQVLEDSSPAPINTEPRPTYMSFDQQRI
jgi:hypothetical protein